ncbi:MAG: peptide deformylase [Patescibacteria group bacterium]|nr:peptide deformylase [Patescibacteria group bacterium]MDE1965782.1 peptide deformylase [Patescibacteria group bacterium]
MAKTLSRTEFGNPVLRMKARSVTQAFLKTPQFKALEKAMLRTMRSADGVGLAAPQIGLPVRIAVMELHPAKKGGRKKGPLTLVNPRIISYSKERKNDWEGCLSCRGIRGLVPRAKDIIVAYTDTSGKKRTEKASGLWARIFQHEIDHLDGTVYVDRMPDMRHLMTTREYKKRILKL